MSDHESTLSVNAAHPEKNHTPGAHSIAEILSQPDCWIACLTELSKSRKLQAVRDRFSTAKEWLFIGCGSSYYVALSAAATMTALTGLRARAVPASEVLLYPEVTLAASSDLVPVLISRSGRTSEVVQAADLLKSRGLSTLGISCTPGQPLESLAHETILLSAADEQSTVMTRSFTSMLLTLQTLAAVIGNDSAFAEALRTAAEASATAFRSIPEVVRGFVQAHDFADYVYLAQGPFYGIACEGALKVTEMSVSYAQVFHTLEFRHGPKSIVGPETLLVFLLSQSGREAELDVMEEMKSLGGTILAIANRVDERIRRCSDLALELGIDAPEGALLAPYLFGAQLLGLYTGLKKGMDPDSPRNLSRSVILKSSDAPA